MRSSTTSHTAFVRRIAWLACLAVLACAGLVACGSDDGGGDTGGGGSTSAGGSDEDKLKDLKLGLVLQHRDDFVKPIIWGAEDAAEEFGVDLQIVGPQQFDGPAQIKMFQDLITTGVKGIVVLPSPADIWARPVKDAEAAGVTVVAANNAAPGIIPLYVGENSIRTGRKITEYILDKLPDKKGSFLIGNAAPGAFPCEQRVKGVKAQLEETAPDIEVKGPFETSGDPAKNFSTWQSLINANPDVVGATDVCFNRIPTVREKDTDGKWYVAGLDLDPVVLDGVKKGFIPGTVGQRPYLQGYVPMRLLIEHLGMGKPMPEGWVDVGMELVTKDNVDDALAIRTDRGKTKEFYKPVIDEIFADPEAATKPMSEVTADR